MERTNLIEKKTVNKKKLKYISRLGWYFVFPGLLAIIVFKWYPLIVGASISLQHYRIVTTEFVGLENFRKVFTDPMTFIVIKNTFYYAFLNICLTFLVPIIIAILLMEMRKGIIRIMMILWFIPMGSMAGIVIWRWFYSVETGLFNAIFTLLGLPTLRWLNDPRLAMICIVLPGLIMFGPGLIYIASLQSIPDELYEAAELEGAGFWRKIWSITLPRLRPIMAVMLILSVITSMEMFSQAYVMTGGGPGLATRTIVMYIVNIAFVSLRYGFGTALAIILFFILLVLTLLQRRYFREDIDK